MLRTAALANRKGRGTRATGDRGEELALEALLERGYELVERNYRTRYGEIDLILRGGDRGEFLVFVEVKLRRGTTFGEPAEAVTPRKQEVIRSVAEQYLAEREPDFTEARFDVVGILESPGPNPETRITHFEAAF